MKKLALALLLALPVAAATDPLSLVPADATAVGMVRLSDIRTSPYAAQLFNETDRCTVDGDAARFLAEAHLRPTEDVDTIVFAATGGSEGAHGSGFVILEGRFEAANVETALLARGATKKSVTGGSLLVLPEGDGHAHDGTPGALAFLDRHLAVGGPQPAVEAALARAASGARTDFRTGAGLGRHMSRVPHDATAWILVDLSRQEFAKKAGDVHVKGEVTRDDGSRQVVQIASLMKQVPFIAMSSSLRSDSMGLSAFAVCEDADTRDLLEDSLRGLLAAWRLAIQDSKPDLVPVLRTFKVEQTKDGVALTGKVPGAALAALFDKEKKAH